MPNATPFQKLLLWSAADPVSDLERVSTRSISCRRKRHSFEMEQRKTRPEPPETAAGPHFVKALHPEPYLQGMSVSSKVAELRKNHLHSSRTKHIATDLWQMIRNRYAVQLRVLRISQYR